jgi:hypothetical protein
VTRRGRRALLLLLVALAATHIGAALALLSPEQLRRRLVAAAHERLRGGEVEIEAVRLRPLERVRIPLARVRPRAPGPGGAVGEIAVEQLVVEHSPLALLSARYVPTRITADEVRITTADAPRLIEAIRALADVDLSGLLAEGGGDPAAGGERAEDAAPIRIARLRIVTEGRPIPLTREGGELLLERVLARPVAAPAGPSRRFDVSATSRVGPFETIDIAGVIDLDAALLTCDVRATNLDVRGRRLEALAPEAGRWFEALGPSGPVDLTLSLSVPWERPAETTVAGLAESYSVALRPPGFPRPITNVSGRIRFDGRRVSLERLRGVYGKGEASAHGSVADAARGAGVSLEVDGAGLDLAELRELPLPEPFGGALAALGLEGRAGLRLSLASAPGESLEESARFRVEAAVSGARALGGALGGVEARALLSGEAMVRAAAPTVSAAADGGGPPSPSGPRAAGTLRIDRASVLGAPLRGGHGRVVIESGALRVEEGEARLADGVLRGGGDVDLAGAGRARLELAITDARLAPFVSYLHGRPIDAAGRASGTLRLDRAARGAGVTARAVLAVAGVDPRTIPAMEPLAAAGLPLGPAPRGAVEVERRRDGSGEARAALSSEPTLALALAFDADLAVEGTAAAGDRRVSFAGPLDRPAVTTASAAPPR